MNRRSCMIPVVASGAATMIKLLVAALAFAGAYVGVKAGRDTFGQGRADTSAPARTITLNSTPTAVAHVPFLGNAGERAEEGVVDVRVRAAPSASACVLRARALLANPAPGTTLLYEWRLLRWSDTTGAWKPYLSFSGGFAGERRTLEWEPRVPDAPARYRVELVAEDGHAIRDELRVTC
ncbi:hypothetical protein [Thermostaphylospora chromogena]|nr:hypothetical protein [Thermostaphylospora chromogena]